jgi:hypothetical protein
MGHGTREITFLTVYVRAIELCLTLIISFWAVGFLAAVVVTTHAAFKCHLTVFIVRKGIFGKEREGERERERYVLIRRKTDRSNKFNAQ